MKTQISMLFAGVKIILASVLVALSACSPFAPAERLATPADTPARFSCDSDKTMPASLWWTEFGSKELNQLVERALARNTSIQEAWARLRQNSAFERMERAALVPELDYSADAAHTRQGRKGEAVSTAEQFRLALAGSYELDLWGRVSANVRAGELETMASMADVGAARVSVAATVAQTWAELETRKAVLPLARRQWEAAVTQVELLQGRYLHGAANSEDLLEQEQEVAQLRTSLEDIGEAVVRLEYELAVLCGDMPGPAGASSGVQAVEPRGLAPLPALEGIGIPADMLRQRPDVRAAALRLHEADWNVAASRAERLPTLRLSADGALSAPHLNEILDNWLATLAASVTGPAFDAGKRRAEVERTMAVVEERLAAYRATVLTAVQEVEIALEQERRARVRVHEARRTCEFRRQIYVQQQVRFLNGDDSMLNLLNARQSLDSSLQSELQARYELYQARIALHRSLGGRMTAVQKPDKIEGVSHEQ